MIIRYNTDTDIPLPNELFPAHRYGFDYRSAQYVKIFPDARSLDTGLQRTFSIETFSIEGPSLKCKLWPF